MRVLIAEDDINIRKGLVEILNDEGYETLEAADGEQALDLFTRERPDFVCLDIMMPGKSGYDVCRSIRRLDENVPIVFVTAKSEEIDKVVGLELGADDYIIKPFGVKEVVARIRAITRRCFRQKAKERDKTFQIGDLTVDPLELQARRKDLLIELSLREVKLLELFYEKQGKVLDRDTLLNRCWGIDYYPNSRTLDQHISNLRKKIEQDPKNPEIILTVHGSGYWYRGQL